MTGFPWNHGIQISKVKHGKTWPEKKVMAGGFFHLFSEIDMEADGFETYFVVRAYQSPG